MKSDRSGTSAVQCKQRNLYPITGKNDDNRRKKNEPSGFAVESGTAWSVPISGEASRGNPGADERGIPGGNHDGLLCDMASSDWRGVGEVGLESCSSSRKRDCGCRRAIVKHAMQC